MFKFLRKHLRAAIVAVTIADFLTPGGFFPVAEAQSVATSFGGNLIVNPWMEIDQIMEGTAVTVTSTADSTFTYGGGGSFAVGTFTLGTTDGWGMTDATDSSSNTLTMQNANLLMNGSATDALVTIGTGSATHGDGTLITFEQRIEPMRLAPLQYGTANAQPTYLSFCAKASIAGNYSFYIAGGTAARTSDIGAKTSGSAYFHQFNIPTAGQVSCYQFVIPGDTGGTWLSTTNTVDATHGATLGFVLAINGVTTATYGVPSATRADGVWQNNTNTGALAQVIGSNTTNVQMDKTSGATFEVSAVKWALDANPLTHNPELELLQAERYLAKTNQPGVGGISGVRVQAGTPANYTGTICNTAPAVTAASTGILWKFPVDMRAVPTIVTFNPKTGGSVKFGDFTNADAQLTLSSDPATSSSRSSVFLKETTDAINAVGDVYCVRAVADARL